MRIHESNTQPNLYEKMIIKDIVLQNFKAVEVMEKYGIDFCCKGKKPINAALEEKNIDKKMFFAELDVVASQYTQSDMRFENWDLVFLTQYIVNNHHSYVRESLPRITAHVNKISERHGDRYPFLYEVNHLFLHVTEEMTSHMEKEEKILFPLIKYLADCKRFEERPKNEGYGTVKSPILKMEQEHDSAGEALYKIREITNNYTLPADACTTYNITYKELEEFERDLHKHVHLENNILFPRAIELEEELLKIKK